MFDCSDDVLAYHDEKTTLRQSDRTAMRNRRNANRDRLKSRLKEAGRPTPYEFIKQGSYAMLTMVQDAENDYDIDDGVYFTQSSLQDKNGKDMPAPDARAMVCEALKDARFSCQPEVRTSCVRVYYNEGYHVDMPVYRIRESDGEYELSSGDAWIVSRAADVEDWFDEINQERSPDEDNGRQFRRMTRLNKKFARSRSSWKPEICAGFTVTKLASEKYVPDSQREDVALRYTMQGIHDRLCISLEVQHPITPSTTLTSGPNDAGTRLLRDKLADALTELDVLDDSQCTRAKALRAWDRVFNTDFFSRRESRKQAAEAAISRTTPAVIVNPARPWTR
jgi:hypothetical protein